MFARSRNTRKRTRGDDLDQRLHGAADHAADPAPDPQNEIAERATGMRVADEKLRTRLASIPDYRGRAEARDREIARSTRFWLIGGRHHHHGIDWVVEHEEAGTMLAALAQIAQCRRRDQADGRTACAPIAVHVSGRICESHRATVEELIATAPWIDFPDWSETQAPSQREQLLEHLSGDRSGTLRGGRAAEHREEDLG